MAFETVKEMLTEKHNHSMMNHMNASLASHTLKAAGEAENAQTDLRTHQESTAVKTSATTPDVQTNIRTDKDHATTQEKDKVTSKSTVKAGSTT